MTARLLLPFRLFWLSAGRVAAAQSDAETSRRFDSAWLIIRAYYAYVSYNFFVESSRAAKSWVTASSGRVKLDLALAEVFPHDMWPGASLVATLAAFVGATVAVWNPRIRLARIASFAGFVLYFAFAFAWKGKVDHGHHAAIWTGFALCLLPAVVERTRETEAAWLCSFFGVQLWVGLLYTCAGICKILGIIYDWPEGVTWLNIDALPLTIAENWNKSRDTLLGGWLIINPVPAWAMNLGALYIELFTFCALYRPHLHRVWGVGIILLHFSIAHSMGIHFHQSAIIVALFLVASPFAPAFCWKSTLLGLPGVHGLYRLMHRRAPGASASEGAAAGQEAFVAPQSPWVRYLTPLAMVFYFGVGFSRLDVKEGEWQDDVYPISAQWMYWRIDSSPRNVTRLAKVRRTFETTGKLYPQRERKPKKRRRK